MEKTKISIEQIYNTLSKIDLSTMVEKKMGITYLSWANAWEVIMDNYPTATFEVLDPIKMDDGSMEILVAVTIHGYRRVMWLPVMDHRNNSIVNPSSRQISDARMRCLVKCLSMFGLGLYIYQGEDLPKKAAEPKLAAKRELTPDNKKVWDNAVAAFKRDGNLNAVKARFAVSQDNELAIAAEASK